MGIEQFVRTMIPVVLGAGRFALDQQGHVENIRKYVQIRSDDNTFLVERKQAKTVIEEQVQETLLLAAHAALAGQSVRIDAEERTASTRLFTSEEADATLIIDPIDGTLQYLNGSPEYSINLALVSRGDVLFALQYFPADKTLYLLDADGRSYHCMCDGDGIVEKKLLEPPQVVKSKIVHANHRVPQQECISQTYTVVKDLDGAVLWSKAFFNCISGEYRVVLFSRPYIWDVVLGAIIAAMPSGYAVDFKGNKVVWPNGGRVPEIAFGFGELPEEIKTC